MHYNISDKLNNTEVTVNNERITEFACLAEKTNELRRQLCSFMAFSLIMQMDSSCLTKEAA